MARREYKGNAIPTRLTAPIGAADTSFSINNNSGWPTGGANGPFSVILEPDVAGKEEHVLVGSQSGGNCTSVTRGYGDTSATTHGVGVDGSVIHGTTKVDYDEANRHINDATLDEHTQYMKADGTRHDLTARHTYGAALGARPTPVAVGTALAAGTGATAAAGDHVHIIGAGAINATTMFAAGVFGLSGDLSTIDGGDTAAAGAVGKVADAGHQHAFTIGTPASLTKVGASATGSSAAHPRLDHVHGTQNLPWGITGTPFRSTVSSAILGSPATSDMTVTVTADAARRYEVTAYSRYELTGGTGDWIITLHEDGTAVAELHGFGGTAEFRGTMSATVEWLPGSGSKVLDIRVTRPGGTGSIQFIGATTTPRYLAVKDIGLR